MLKFLKSNRFKSFIYALFAIVIILFLINNVPSRLTKKDKLSIEKFIGDLEIDKVLIQKDYNYQIKVLTQISNKVLDEIKPSSDGIPTGQSREPSIQIAAGYGQCFDRSRLIEKICRSLGFKTRHLYIIQNDQGRTLIKALLSSNTNSHATSEIKTNKGWIVIDSNFKWLSVSEENLPIPFSKLNKVHNLTTTPPEEVIPFYLSKTYRIYGFYSRHGYFYKPYLPIPDYNIRELLYNF